MPADSSRAWVAGPRQPVLEDGAVHVWRADLAAVSDDVGDSLSDDERARAERFASARDGERWRRGRGLLRVLLGRYLRREPGSLRFAVGEHGKPALAGDDASPTHAANAAHMSFNISHSGALALYAFSATGAVGVDVEVARRAIDEVAVAARTLGKPAAERLQALDPAARRREFLSAWTRHEAELKCLGTGIGGAAAAPPEPRALWVLELAVGQNAAAAVACERAPSQLRRWRWPGA